MIPFSFNENRFSFFVKDHLLVGQLCTNPMSDRSLLTCLKVTQCSTSEIGDALLYNSWSLPIQLMTIWPLPAPSKCKSGLPRITGTCSRGWKQSFRLWLWFLVWFQVRATSCHLTSSKSAWKSTPQFTWMCWRVWWSPGKIRWSAADPWWVSRTRRRPTSPKRPRLGFRRSATTLYPSLTGPCPPPTWTRWTTSFGHTSRTSPTWPPTIPKPAWLLPSTEDSPSSRQRCGKGVLTVPDPYRGGDWGWRRLHWIIKLPEFIFSIKVLK